MNTDIYILQKDALGLKAGQEFILIDVNGHEQYFPKGGENRKVEAISISPAWVESNPEWFKKKEEAGYQLGEPHPLDVQHALGILSRAGYEVKKLQKTGSEKLFTTEDGVDIYKGDYDGMLYHLNSQWIITPMSKMTMGVIESKSKIFSTKEKAQEYITLNKPCLSVADICAIWSIDKQSRNTLLEKAKQKITHA